MIEVYLITVTTTIMGILIYMGDIRDMGYIWLGKADNGRIGGITVKNKGIVGVLGK